MARPRSRLGPAHSKLCTGHAPTRRTIGSARERVRSSTAHGAASAGAGALPIPFVGMSGLAGSARPHVAHARGPLRHFLDARHLRAVQRDDRGRRTRMVGRPIRISRVAQAHPGSRHRNRGSAQCSHGLRHHRCSGRGRLRLARLSAARPERARTDEVRRAFAEGLGSRAAADKKPKAKPPGEHAMRLSARCCGAIGKRFSWSCW